jgi:hypothetical protein
MKPWPCHASERTPGRRPFAGCSGRCLTTVPGAGRGLVTPRGRGVALVTLPRADLFLGPALGGGRGLVSRPARGPCAASPLGSPRGVASPLEPCKGRPPEPAVIQADTLGARPSIRLQRAGPSPRPAFPAPARSSPGPERFLLTRRSGAAHRTAPGGEGHRTAPGMRGATDAPPPPAPPFPCAEVSHGSHPGTAPKPLLSLGTGGSGSGGATAPPGTASGSQFASTLEERCPRVFPT